MTVGLGAGAATVGARTLSNDARERDAERALRLGPLDHNLVATHTIYTNDATNWLLGRVDEKKVVSHYTLIISHPPPPDWIDAWEKDIYAANGVEIQERDRLLCDAASRCHCPTGQDCTPRNPDGTNARWVRVEQGKT